MKKIICIGESSVDIVFEGREPVGAVTGGRIANAAAMLARDTLPVTMVSEAGADPMGDRVVSFLSDAGVDISAIDRFTEGHTPLNLYTDDPDGTVRITRYADYGQACFDIIWPRVDDDTIVVFGGYYSLDRRVRQHLLPFLTNCQERGALMVYIPGFMPQRESRITRVMPAILENLETAHMVIARRADLNMIFGTDTSKKCYADHIDFYCRSMVAVDAECRTIEYFAGHELTQARIPEDICLSLHWNAGVIAGTVASIYEQRLTPDRLDAPAEDIRKKILSAAVASAARAARDLKADWQRKL